MKVRWMGCFFALGSVLLGERLTKVPLEKRKVSGPPTEVGGDGSRPILRIRFQERGDFVGSEARIRYQIFDTAKPNLGLREIAESENGNYNFSISNLLGNGWGTASGVEDPEGGKMRCWFNILTGEIGEQIKSEIWAKASYEGWLVGAIDHEDKAGKTTTRLGRYHVRRGLEEICQLPFRYVNWLNHDDIFEVQNGDATILGVALIDGRDRVVIFDFAKWGYRVVGPPPPDFSENNDGGLFSMRIEVAGNEAVDGIYAVNGFDLWYLPKDGKWRKVIGEVPITKTFGGAPPSLPVRYLGGGRFAVSRTTRSRMEVPKEWPDDEKLFGAAQAETLLLDGRTGNLIEGSKRFIYSENPPLKISKDWWRGGMTPRKKEEVVGKDLKTAFSLNEKTREVSFGGKEITIGEEEIMCISDKGNWAVLFDQCPERGNNPKTEVKLRILDGKTGRTYDQLWHSEFHEVWTDANWLILGES